MLSLANMLSSAASLFLAAMFKGANGSCLNNVEAACGNPWLWNYVLRIAKEDNEFHGLVRKGATGVMQLRCFANSLVPSERGGGSRQLTTAQVAERLL
jgi:hypothetical protein